MYVSGEDRRKQNEKFRVRVKWKAVYEVYSKCQLPYSYSGVRRKSLRDSLGAITDLLADLYFGDFGVLDSMKKKINLTAHVGPLS